MTVVIAGATGFVGQNLVAHLETRGASVRCGTRNPDRARAADPSRTWVRLDVEDPSSLEPALEGADALVYLVHQMRADAPDLVELEAQSADRVRTAAEAAGVRRIVYLGGPSPTEGEPSKHLRARLRTGEALRSGSVSTVELRAPMVVGPGSVSWLMVRDLALRLPVMVLPSWLARRSQPIAIADVVEALTAAVSLEHGGSAWYHLPGPETLAAREILERIAALRGMRPLMVPVPVLTPRLSSHWIRLVSRADYEVARQLVDGLSADLIAPDDGFWDLVPQLRRTPFDDAARLALAAESPTELTRFSRAWERVARRVGRLRARR